MKDYIFCLVGYSGSGKTTLSYELQKKYGYNVIESYTTRKPRYEGEKGHIFVMNPKALSWVGGKAIPSNVIAYSNRDGLEYWITREQYQGKGVSVYVVDVPGVETLRKTTADAEIITIALWLSPEEIRSRLINRKVEEHRIKNKRYDSNYNYPMLESEDLVEIKDRMEYDKDAFSIIPCNYVIDANEKIDIVAERVDAIIKKYITKSNIDTDIKTKESDYKNNNRIAKRVEKQKLFIDFDLTIVDSISAFCDVYNLYYRSHSNFVSANPNKITSYDFHCICPLLKTQIERERIWESHSFFSYLEFIKYNTYEILEKLNEKYQIIIVSIGTPKNIALKAKWLKMKLPFIKDYVLISNENNVMDKSIVNMENAIFIDDMPSNLESSNAKEKLLFGRSYSWNTGWEGKKCEDWTEIEKLLL